MRGKRLVVGGVGIAMLAIGPALEAQERNTLPLLPPKPSGQGVSPVFEGWYRNPDGTYTLSYGYINRNRQVEAEVPVGENNFVEPAEYNGLQPSRFDTHRHYGWFTVRVPADFEGRDVVWTIQHNGERFAIPARIIDGYEIDAMRAPASGETPPFLRVLGSEEVRGPHGVRVGPLSARVGEPLEIEVSGRDEHNEITLRWYDYQGPAPITFAQTRQTIPQEGGTVTNSVTFAEPGDYVVYVRANNGPLVASGQEQCCWTNGYVQVSVTR